MLSWITALPAVFSKRHRAATIRVFVKSHRSTPPSLAELGSGTFAISDLGKPRQ
jgi:hypothetical protein